MKHPNKAMEILLVEVTPREERTKPGEADSIDKPLPTLCD